MPLETITTVKIVKGVIDLAKAGASAPSKYRAWRERRRETGVASSHIDDLVEALLKAVRAGADEDTDRDSPIARHTWIILCAFGEAWGRQRAYRRAEERALPIDDASHTVLVEQLATRLHARWRAPLAPGVPDAKIDLELINGLTGDPLRTLPYLAVWEAFTDPDLGETLIDTKGDEKLAFEQYFRLAYNEALASEPGEPIRRYLHGLEQERPRLVNRLLLQRMADWDTRHVFGNVSHHEQMRDLPLRDMYVEPWAKREGEHETTATRPVRAFIRELLRGNNIVVVKAHFGYGKSLTARYLAWELVRQFLASDAPSVEVPRPIFIKCAEDFISIPVNINEATRHAIWRQQANELKLDLPLSDSAHATPSPDERVLFILDGLDEVTLGETALNELFRRLREESGRNRQFLVFSRPEALPHDLLGKLGVPVLELQPLASEEGNNQVVDWLTRWNRLHPDDPPITIQGIRERNLEEVATTPILLFMIAFTWNASTGDTSGSVASIYERFFRQIAAGKAEVDAERHAPIAKASQYLLERLRSSGDLREGADHVDAMLWLLGRMAWEAHRLAQRDTGHPLTRDDVKYIVRDELDLRSEHDVAQCVTIGLLLAMQADLEGSNHEILFGHKSFREFLVARHWKMQLGKALHRDNEQELPDHMLGARLLQEGDRSFKFLTQLLMEWSQDLRIELRRWASKTFNDDTIVVKSGRANLREDLRAGLREAALAIGSNLGLRDGITVKPRRLRSLLAWFWQMQSTPILLAPRIVMHGPEVERILLVDCDLSNGEIFDSSLQCFRVNLNGTRIRPQPHGFLHLTDCEFIGADVSGWRRGHLILNGCRAQGAVFDVQFTACDISNTNLSGASLRGIRLHTRFYDNSTPQEAVQFDIADTNLAEADLFGADLSRLRLRDVSLVGANLEGADLRGVVGKQINADGARVTNVKWAGANIEWTAGGRPAGAPDMPVPSEEQAPEQDEHDLLF